jgi:hypothetical protein
MGVLIRRDEDAELYKDTYEEAQRIVRISDEVRITLERVSATEGTGAEARTDSDETSDKLDKLTTSKLAQRLGVKTAELLERFVTNGYLELREGKHYITAKGKEAGGEFRKSPRFGAYFLWPEDAAA